MDETSISRHTSNVGNKLIDFKIWKELGKGSYGTVYTVKSHIDDNIYVMKKLELNNWKEKQQKECWREVSILKKVNHPNIIKYYSSFLEFDNWYIIMEYAESGDLYALIKHYKRHKKHWEEFDIWRIVYEWLKGLEYLHKNNIIHRDIKWLNLFITKDKHIKIGDWGVSTIVSNMNAWHCTRVGTPLYLSPELIKQIPYDFKVDIWSFGCSIYHIACLEPPFSGDNLIVLGNNIVQGKHKNIPDHYSGDLSKLIDRALSKRPDKRFSAVEGFEMIPKDILDRIVKARDYNIDIKTRPFSSMGNKLPTSNEDGGNINDNTESAVNDNKNNNALYRESAEKNKEIAMKNDINNIGIWYDIKEDNAEVEKKEDKPDKNHIKNKSKDEWSKNVNNCNTNIKHGIHSTKAPEVLKDKNVNNQLQLKPQQTQVPTIIDQHNLNPQNNENHNPLPKERTIDTSNNNNNLYTNRIHNINPSNNGFRTKINRNIENGKTSKNYTNINGIFTSGNTSSKVSTPLTLKALEPNQTATKITPIAIQSRNSHINPNHIEIVKNYMISPDDLDMKTHNPKPKIRVQTQQNFFNDKALPQGEDISNNVDLKFPDWSNVNIIKEKYINKNALKRISSSKYRNPSCDDWSNNNNNNLWVNNMKGRPGTANAFNGNTRSNAFTNKTKSNSSRPWTAINAHNKNNNINNNNNGNIINININFYNLDMNKRFLAPNINPWKGSLSQRDKRPELSWLQTLPLENINNNNNNCHKINLRKYANNNSQQNNFVFDRIIKTLEHSKHERRLTINDVG